DLVPEQLAGDVAALQPRDRLAQRVREALGVRLVRVALERRRERELVLDAVQAGGDQRGEGEGGGGVAAGDGRFRAQRARVADDAEAAGAVVVAPGERGRRPAAGREALVRVDRRRDEDRQVAEQRDLPGEVVVEDGAVGERRLVAAPEARVNVARGAGPRGGRVGQGRGR